MQWIIELSRAVFDPIDFEAFVCISVVSFEVISKANLIAFRFSTDDFTIDYLSLTVISLDSLSFWLIWPKMSRFWVKMVKNVEFWDYCLTLPHFFWINNREFQTEFHTFHTVEFRSNPALNFHTSALNFHTYFYFKEKLPSSMHCLCKRFDRRCKF